MSEFCMPSLGADMDAGTLVEWRVKPGDRVKRGDIVALVETQKGIVEVEVWESGTVDAILVEPGAQVPVGTPLARIGASADGGAEAKPAPAAPALAPATSPAPATAPAAPRPQASPAARQLARELAVDLSNVRGTGPHGAITRADVEHAAAPRSPATVRVPPSTPALAPAAAPAAKSAASPSAATAMRQAIAAAMARSKREIPHYYLATEIDVSRAVAWLEAENAQRPVTERVLFAAVLLKATALAIGEVPEVNGFFVDGSFRRAEAPHLGVAIALRQGGLVAPAIHDVHQLSVVEVMTALRDLVARARAGTLRSSEMSDPTITVTNLGDQGVTSVFGVIYPPQVALVGFGKVVQRPWAEQGMLGVRPVVTATLAADHRVSDGHRGAVFLAAIGRRLAEPEKL